MSSSKEWREFSIYQGSIRTQAFGGAKMVPDLGGGRGGILLRIRPRLAACGILFNSS